MRIFITVFWVIIIAVLLGLFSLNVGQTVTIDLIFTEFEAVNLVTVVYLSVLAGFLLGMTLWLVRYIRDKKEIMALKKQLRQYASQKKEKEDVNTLPEAAKDTENQGNADDSIA